MERVIASPRPMPLLAAEEPHEQPAEVFGGDADAGVADLEPQVALTALDGHGDGAAGRGVLHRVGDEVVDDLPQSDRVPGDDQPRLHALPQGQPLLQRVWRVVGHRLGDDAGHVDGLDVEGDVPLVRLGRQQEVADQSEQPLGVPLGDLELPSP
jgi:hypothetical protein